MSRWSWVDTNTAIVVDDNVDHVSIFSELLRAKEFDVVGVGFDGFEAVELYRNLKPDFVFLDLFMHNYDGLYAYDIIRQMDPDANIVMLAANKTPDVICKLKKRKTSVLFYKTLDTPHLRMISEKLSSLNPYKN